MMGKIRLRSRHSRCFYAAAAPEAEEKVAGAHGKELIVWYPISQYLAQEYNYTRETGPHKHGRPSLCTSIVQVDAI